MLDDFLIGPQSDEDSRADLEVCDEEMKVSQEIVDRSCALTEIVATAMDKWGSLKPLNKWLHTEHPQLSMTPMQAVKAGKAQEVYELLLLEKEADAAEPVHQEAAGGVPQ